MKTTYRELIPWQSGSTWDAIYDQICKSLGKEEFVKYDAIASKFKRCSIDSDRVEVIVILTGNDEKAEFTITGVPVSQYGFAVSWRTKLSLAKV